MELTTFLTLLSEQPSIDVEDKKIADKILFTAMKAQIILERTANIERDSISNTVAGLDSSAPRSGRPFPTRP